MFANCRVLVLSNALKKKFITKKKEKKKEKKEKRNLLHSREKILEEFFSLVFFFRFCYNYYSKSPKMRKQIKTRYMVKHGLEWSGLDL